MEKVSYALGMSIANNIKTSGVKDLDINSFVEAVKAALAGETTSMSIEEAKSLLDTYFAKLQEKQSESVIAVGAKFLEENAKKASVVTLPSGLQYEVIKDGAGVKPTESDKVRCHYEGTLLDGTVFDSSYQRNEPAIFGVTQVIQGWIEALQLMNEGSKWKLYIPYNLAYGERGAGQAIPPYSALIFDVELLEIVK